jgi:hypothetical protein
MVVTEQAYLNHLGRRTADRVHPLGWVDLAHRENADGMTPPVGTRLERPALRRLPRT